jgi:tetratricopeptide (TPR) repeat protein
MLEYIEVHKIDPQMEWVEILAADQDHGEPTVIRAVISDAQEMAVTFSKRYTAKREGDLKIPGPQIQILEEFFEECCMAAVIAKGGEDSTDLKDLLPTTIIHFKYPERTTFRKSRTARIKLFSEEAFSYLQARDFDRAMARLDWIHHLDPRNELAFELKIVCLRSARKMAECVAVFETWCETHPNQIEPHIGLSEMWLFLEQYRKAKEGFERILEAAPKHPMALIGLAQAKLKLSESPLHDLRKAWLLDQGYTVRMVENALDFRRSNPDDLEPMSLSQIAKHYRIPLKRVIERTNRGVLPFHPPKEEKGLLRFSTKDLELHYTILKSLGLEITTGTLNALQKPPKPKAQSEAVQPSLFEEDEKS